MQYAWIRCTTDTCTMQNRIINKKVLIFYVNYNNIFFAWPCKYIDLCVKIHNHIILLCHFGDTTVYNALQCYLINSLKLISIKQYPINVVWICKRIYNNHNDGNLILLLKINNYNLYILSKKSNFYLW